MKPSEQNDVEDQLQRWFRAAQRVVVLGIGNSFRKDDAVGIQIARTLQNKVSKAVLIIEGETVPESFIGPITEFDPTHILIIDAGLLNMEPGSLKLVDPNQLSRRTAISTHTLPLAIFCEYLTRTTKAKIVLVVVQPRDTSFGENLSPIVEKTATRLANLLLKLLPADTYACP